MGCGCSVTETEAATTIKDPVTRRQEEANEWMNVLKRGEELAIRERLKIRKLFLLGEKGNANWTSTVTHPEKREECWRQISGRPVIIRKGKIPNRLATVTHPRRKCKISSRLGAVRNRGRNGKTSNKLATIRDRGRKGKISNRTCHHQRSWKKREGGSWKSWKKREKVKSIFFHRRIPWKKRENIKPTHQYRSISWNRG